MSDLKKYKTGDLLECFDPEQEPDESWVCQNCERPIIEHSKARQKVFWFDHDHDWYFCTKKCGEWR